MKNYFLVRMRLAVLLTIAILLTYNSQVLASDVPVHQTQSAFKKDFKFATSTHSKVPISRFTTTVLTKAFNKIGYGYQPDYCPFKRCLMNMEKGKVDGNAYLFGDFADNQQFNQYIKIPEAHSHVILAVYTRDPNLKINSWAELGASRLTIGYRKGVAMRLFENKLNRYVALNVAHLNSSSNRQGLQQLLAKRYDAYLFGTLDFRISENKKAYEKKGIYLAGYLEKVAQYSYIHQQYKSLVIPLAEAIKATKEDGTVDTIVKEINSQSPLF